MGDGVCRGMLRPEPAKPIILDFSDGRMQVRMISANGILAAELLSGAEFG